LYAFGENEENGKSVMPRGQRLNNINIDAIQVAGADKRTPKGADMFSDTYPNIALIAKKKSGKTNLLYHILKNIIDPSTEVYLFVSTAKRDATWKDIIKYLEKQGNKVVINLGIYDRVMVGKRKKKINKLEQLIDSFRVPDEKKGKGKKRKKTKKIERDRSGRSMYDRKITISDLPENHLYHTLFQNGSGFGVKHEQPKPEPKQKPKKQSGGKHVVPERLIIFDDLSNELNDPQVARLLKANRHFLATTITSTQYVNDIPPTARSQFDIVIAFKGHTPNKIETIRKMCDTNVDEEDFYSLYKEATAEPYSFLYCNCRDNSFRVNFDEELTV